MRKLRNAILLLLLAPGLCFGATVASDSFTEAVDVFIELHVPSPTGTSWTPDELLNTTVVGATDNVQPEDSASIVIAREGTDVGDDDMDVSVDITMNTNNSAHRAGCAARIAGADLINYYQVYAVGNSGTVRTINLEKTVAGAVSSLGTYDLTTVANTDVTTLKLEIRTAAKKVYTNGTERISTADDSLTGNNFGGLYGRNTSPRIDNYLCESVGAAAATAPQIIQLPKWLESAVAYADDGLCVGYYESRVIGTGRIDDPRRPKDIPAGAKGWVLLYDHGVSMEYKVLAEPDVLASIPVIACRTRASLSQVCLNRIFERGEPSIDRR